MRALTLLTVGNYAARPHYVVRRRMRLRHQAVLLSLFSLPLLLVLFLLEGGLLLRRTRLLVVLRRHNSHLRHLEETRVVLRVLLLYLGCDFCWHDVHTFLRVFFEQVSCSPFTHV